MSNQLVQVNEDHPHITILTMNRPDKRNALNRELMRQLTQAIENAGQNPDQRVLILRGEGSAFCSGMDLTEAADQTTPQLVMRMLQTFYTSSLITIAAVHGAAMAAGAGLTAACDFVIAGKDTKFGFPETSRGIVPAIVMCFLIRQIPYRTVREMLILADTFDAPRALSSGLINWVVPDAELNTQALKIAQKVLDRAPEAVIKTKQLLEELYPGKLDADVKKALAYLQSSINSGEAEEGIQAFLERREPNWK